MENLWTLVALACRYGHQPVSEVRAMSVEELRSFNDALYRLIDAENKTGRGHTNQIAEGGG